MPKAYRPKLSILAIETATDACSVAFLNTQGELFEEFDITPRQHTSCLPKMLKSVLGKAGVDHSEIGCIGFSHGPGAFTGVRIGAAMAQGMALGLGVPVVPVSTLAAQAQQACDQLGIDRVQASLDARMGEVYTGLFEKSPVSGLVQAISEESLVKLEQFQVPAGTAAVGSGMRAKREAGLPLASDDGVYEDVYPSASALSRLATELLANNDTCRAEHVQINYIRNQVAWKKNNSG